MLSTSYISTCLSPEHVDTSGLRQKSSVLATERYMYAFGRTRRPFNASIIAMYLFSEPISLRTSKYILVAFRNSESLHVPAQLSGGDLLGEKPTSSAMYIDQPSEQRSVGSDRVRCSMLLGPAFQYDQGRLCTRTRSSPPGQAFHFNWGGDVAILNMPHRHFRG